MLMNVKYYLLVLFIPFILLFGCRDTAKSMNMKTKKPSPQILEGLSAKEALAQANSWKKSKADVESFVTPDKIHFNFNSGESVKIPLPTEEMVIALAPYRKETHPCEVHYMSGCQGELVNFPVKVKAEGEDGTILIDTTMKTMHNGFIELWLPRGQEILLTLESRKGRTQGKITTFSDSYTCITTLQLL
jgi:hypothetical protein